MHLNTAQAVYGALAGFLSLYTIATIGKLVKGQDVMGQGDFKLLAAMGIYIGLKGAIFAVFFSPFVGILTWLILKIFKNGGNTLPYGPSLIIGSIFYMIYGETFLRYLGIVI
jgi:leader peptidase (prepilin peptidase)/N-methyltransferase